MKTTRLVVASILLVAAILLWYLGLVPSFDSLSNGQPLIHGSFPLGLGQSQDLLQSYSNEAIAYYSSSIQVFNFIFPYLYALFFVFLMDLTLPFKRSVVLRFSVIPVIAAVAHYGYNLALGAILRSAATSGTLIALNSFAVVAVLGAVASGATVVWGVILRIRFTTAQLEADRELMEQHKNEEASL